MCRTAVPRLFRATLLLQIASLTAVAWSVGATPLQATSRSAVRTTPQPPVRTTPQPAVPTTQQPQEGRITGRVVDAGTGQGLTNVEVTIIGTTWATRVLMNSKPGEATGASSVSSSSSSRSSSSTSRGLRAGNPAPSAARSSSAAACIISGNRSMTVFASSVLSLIASRSTESLSSRDDVAMASMGRSGLTTWMYAAGTPSMILPSSLIGSSRYRPSTPPAASRRSSMVDSIGTVSGRPSRPYTNSGAPRGFRRRTRHPVTIEGISKLSPFALNASSDIGSLPP